MDVFSRLIGKKVEIYCPVFDEFFEFDGNENLEYSIIKGEKCIILKAEVVNIDINDFYFYEKQYEIYLTIECKPIGDVPNGIDDCDYRTTLEYIRYAGS
jgi:hypothetical protein